MFTLREMGPDDGAAFAELHANSPDGGAVQFTAAYHIDAYTYFKTVRPTMIAVVAEHPSHEGIVGAGMVSFIDAQWDGVVRKTALLSALMVHPDVRRQGLAAKLAAWRIEKAREVVGVDGVIYAMIQGGNVGSEANARKWATQFISGRLLVPAPVRQTPPDDLPQYTVREAEPADYAQIADAANAFYADYNCHIPLTAEKIARKIANTPFDTPVHSWQVVADGAGNLVAGIAVTDTPRMQTGRIVSAPPEVQKFLPPDGVTRMVGTRDLWHRPGHEAAATHLWRSVCYAWRDRATMVRCDVDYRSPVYPLLDLPPSGPSTSGALAVCAPVRVDVDQLINPYF